jgi:hypothetical protein
MIRSCRQGDPNGFVAGTTAVTLAAEPDIRDRSKVAPDRPPSTLHRVCLDAVPAPRGDRQ